VGTLRRPNWMFDLGGINRAPWEVLAQRWERTRMGERDLNLTDVIARARLQGPVSQPARSARSSGF